MTHKMIKFICYLSALLFSANISAQKNWNDIDRSNIISADTTLYEGYTLIFINKDSAIDSKLQPALTGVFFKVYPQEASLYNAATNKQVVFIVDPGYDGVAATAGGIVRFNPGWFHKHPEDIDVVTHEAMHIVQAYPDEAGPWWITEGIADYVRYRLGVNNEKAGWKLTEYSAKQKYDNGYRITARFLVWIEKKYDPDFVKKIDAAMRSKTYKKNMWKQYTGKGIDELWGEYAKDPEM